MPSMSHVVADAIYGASHAIIKSAIATANAANRQPAPCPIYLCLFIRLTAFLHSYWTHLTFALRHAANHIVTRWFQVDYIAL